MKALQIVLLLLSIVFGQIPDTIYTHTRTRYETGLFVSHEKHQLIKIYENWLRIDPQLSGVLRIKFTIKPDGSSDVSIIESTTHDEDFDRSILQCVKHWLFPPKPGSNLIEITYPFLFGEGDQ